MSPPADPHAYLVERFALDGLRAVVTGGSSGIGRGIALALARAGATVALVARTESSLIEAVADIDEQSGRSGAACWFSTDLADRGAVERLGADALATFGPPSILVNAAAVNLRPPMADLTEVEWDRTIELNLTVPHLLAQRFAPLMAEQGYGRIINLASQQAIRAFGNSGAYGASKAGIVGLTRSQAEAWARSGVTANAISPAFVETPSTAAVFSDPAVSDAMAARTMTGTNGVVADLEGLAVFLAGPSSGAVTGQLLYADAGVLGSLSDSHETGVLSDVHGNRTALEAVVADGAECGVEQWWALGDLVAIGPDPVGTLELMANLPGLVATRGNTERYVMTGDRPPPHAADVAADLSLLDLFAAVEGSFSWTRGVLAASGWSDWIAALPLETRARLEDGTRLLGVHASPGRDDGDGITPHRPDEDLLGALQDAEADVVLAGHTHQPTDRRVGDVRAVNLGSVSNPITDDLRASFVVVEADRHGHRLTHRRVAYDRDAFLREVAASGHPEHDFIASFQRGEQYRYPAVRPGAPVITD